MPLYEFDCPTCGRVERRATVGVLEATCPKCGRVSPRVYSSSFVIHNVPGYFEACEETDRMMKAGKIASISPADSLIRKGLEEK